MNNMIKNKGTGRREIKQIVAKNIRHVTFSKRRVGLFKKASELCAVTGAECAVLCESLGGHVFAFGHPSVEFVVDKYLSDKSSSELPKNNYETDVNSPCMHDKLKKQYLEIAQEIEIEKKKSVKVMRGKNDDFNISDNMEKGDLFWWEQPFDHLGVEELEEYVSSMEQLMNYLKLRADDLMLIKSSSSIFDAHKTLNNSNDAGLSDESITNKNLVTMDIDGKPDELLVNFSDDDRLDKLLAMDDELHDFFNDIQLRDNNVLVPNVYGDTDNEVQLPRNNGNYVGPDDYGRAMDLRNFDAAGVLPNDFSYYFPPN